MLKRIIAFTFVLVVCSAGFAVSAQNAAAPGSRRLSYGIVVDNSGSYRQLLDRVIRFTHGVKDRNIEGDETFLVTFVDGSKTKVRQELTSDFRELGEAVDNMFIEGGASAVLDAVRFSIDYISANAKERSATDLALLLISDGDDSGSSAKLETVVAAAKEAGVRIIVVGVSDDKLNTKLLDKLAKGTGGTSFFPKTPKEMTEMTQNVAAAIRGR